MQDEEEEALAVALSQATPGKVFERWGSLTPICVLGHSE
jgi:hypothetical protein